MTTGLIICGAFGKEGVDIVDKHGWDGEVIGNRFSRLKSEDFRNYKCMVYLAQIDVPEYRLKAHEIAVISN